MCRRSAHSAHVWQTLGLPTVPMHLWSDSTVALRIRDYLSRWQTYVANQVAEIQTTLAEAQWHHLPGLDNPADCVSRGISPGELVTHPLWWSGPSWLRTEDSTWPAAPAQIADSDLPEVRSRVHVAASRLTSNDEPAELTCFASLNRLLRVTAWCKRWLLLSCGAPLRMDPGCSPTRPLTVAEVKDVRQSWLRTVQAATYKEELKAIRLGKKLPSKSSLIKLTPFLDSQGLLRVGGRLKHALLAFDERHPVILPNSSHLARLVVEACHRRTLHGGVQLTLGTVRQQYWIPRGRAVVKAVILRCVTCVRQPRSNSWGTSLRVGSPLLGPSCTPVSITQGLYSCELAKDAATAPTRPSSLCSSALVRGRSTWSCFCKSRNGKKPTITSRLAVCVFFVMKTLLRLAGR
jgi:hypothetical protein